MVVGSVDGPNEALGCVIYCFLVKFAEEKEQVTDRRTDGPTYRPTDGRTHRDARTYNNGDVISELKGTTEADALGEGLRFQDQVEEDQVEQKTNKRSTK